MLQVRVMPSTTSKTSSLRRCTRWLRFICSSGWPGSMNTCGAFGASKETSLTQIFSSEKVAAAGAGAAPLRVSSDISGTPDQKRKRESIAPILWAAPALGKGGKHKTGSSPLRWAGGSRPVLRAAFHQRQVGLLPGGDAAIEPVDLFEAGFLQSRGGRGRGLAGAADRHHRQRLGGGQL